MLSRCRASEGVEDHFRQDVRGEVSDGRVRGGDHAAQRERGGGGVVGDSKGVGGETYPEVRERDGRRSRRRRGRG